MTSQFHNNFLKKIWFWLIIYRDFFYMREYFWPHTVELVLRKRQMRFRIQDFFNIPLIDESGFHLDSSDCRSMEYHRVGDRYTYLCVFQRLTFWWRLHDGLEWNYCSWIDTLSYHQWKFKRHTIPWWGSSSNILFYLFELGYMPSHFSRITPRHMLDVLWWTSRHSRISMSLWSMYYHALTFRPISQYWMKWNDLYKIYRKCRRPSISQDLK